MYGPALNNCATKAIFFYVRKIGRPVAAVAYAPGYDAFAIHVRPGGQIIEHARKHPLRTHVRLNGRLSGTGHVYRDDADSAAEHRVPSLNFVFLARIGSIDHEHNRRRPHILWQSDVSGNFFTFERNMDDFDWRI